MSINNMQYNQQYQNQGPSYPLTNNVKSTYKVGTLNDLNLFPMQYPSLNKNTSYHHDLGSQKKHYAVYYDSEISRFDMFRSPQKDDPSVAIAEYPRNLTTNDIQGAYAGTHKSKAVKNLEYAKSFRPEPRSTEPYDILDKVQESYSVNRNLEGGRSPTKVDYDQRRNPPPGRGYSSEPEYRSIQDPYQNQNKSVLESITTLPNNKNNQNPETSNNYRGDVSESDSGSKNDARLNKIVSYNIISNVPTSHYKSPKLPNGYSISHDPGKLEILKKLYDDKRGIFQPNLKEGSSNLINSSQDAGMQRLANFNPGSDFYAGKSNAYDYINYRYAQKQKTDQQNQHDFYGPRALKNLSGLVIN